MSERKRKSIPKSLRYQVWNKYHEKEVDVKCPLCKFPMDLFHFDCAHIISVFNGGETTLDNLRPLCGTCNSSMGSRNWDEYIEIKQPEIKSVMEPSTIYLHKKKSYDIGYETGFDCGRKHSFYAIPTVKEIIPGVTVKINGINMELDDQSFRDGHRVGYQYARDKEDAIYERKQIRKH